VKHHVSNREPSRVASSTRRYSRAVFLRSSGCVVPFALLSSVLLQCKGSEPRPQSACGCPVAFLADCSCRGWLNRSRPQNPLRQSNIAHSVPNWVFVSLGNDRAICYSKTSWTGALRAELKWLPGCASPAKPMSPACRECGLSRLIENGYCGYALPTLEQPASHLEPSGWRDDRNRSRGTLELTPWPKAALRHKTEGLAMVGQPKLQPTVRNYRSSL